MNLWFVLVLIPLVKSEEVQDEIAPEESNLKCYYCGIKDNCQLPFDTEEGKLIECDKSCLKFDGLAKDGKRIVIRNCGYFTTNECIEEASYEDKDTIGTICHCLDDQCNTALNLNAQMSSFILMLILTFLFH